MGVFKFLLAGASVALVALACAQPGYAQVKSEPPLSDDTGGLVLATQGYKLWMPVPDWLDASAQQSGDIRPLVEANFRDGESGSLLEIYPKGESEAL